MTVPNDEQRDKLERQFGAIYNMVQLTELDHKSSNRYRSRVLPHGPDFAQHCSLCLEEAAREIVIDQRKQCVLNELIGETVWVRSYGYKTMRKATVGVREKGGGEGVKPEYLIVLNWEGEPRPSSIEKIPRLDVVMDGERQNVWDDGVEDLNIWEREKLSTSARACDNQYHTGFNVHMPKNL